MQVQLNRDTWFNEEKISFNTMLEGNIGKNDSN
jgi:hypothetical protein